MDALATDYDYLFKVLLIGDSGVGKSSVLLRYIDEMFTELFLSTIGVDFKLKTIMCHDKKVKLQIWDTAGQERFKTITRSYYRGASAVIVIYDVTDKDSFSHLSNWLNEIKQNTECDKIDVVSILVGNKIDLEKKRVIPYQDGATFAAQNNMQFVEVSSKTGENVEKIFDLLVNELVKKRSFKMNKPEIILNSKSLQNKKSCCN